ncbi:uncharacterized protein N7483_005838 [Penicillium malachiteum]|uniref:uncharacterized protein n=1 Tax=Penicillium malachiteum TaxID=1324776 RepID=UPI0025472A5F|nr:uncharacterized protein N7483_005838 [Penicillium malachiteum]KAJ5731330.1 hypothetical protein N7483_005838 [Penicillium malachiteum]
MESTIPDWLELVARKRNECREKIPKEWILPTEHLNNSPHLIEYDAPRRSGLLSELELDITENYTATQLLRKLAVGNVTSLDVTTAFCKRAAIAQQLTLCLTETAFPEALERARFLDAYLEREKKPIGPLHGLPISVKDSFCIEGLQSTVGYVSFLKNAPETKNSALVAMLLDLGAVLYVKTNIPQTMMTGDSENNIFGRTLNPHNTALTAGGSSGGEGALVGFRGSILGVGTDIAGSIRIPALCCGVYGFKPTVDRVPFGGQVSGAMEGLPGLKPAAGPLAHSVSDLQLFMKTILKDGQAWKYDTTASGAPWIDGPRGGDARNGRLTIGVLSEDKQFPLHPPIKRALDLAVERLTRAGHRIVRIESPSEELSVSYASRLAFQYFIYGPAEDHITPSGEPLVESVAKFSSPMFTGPFPVDQILEIVQKINELHHARLRVCDSWRQVWIDHHLDVLLAPGSQSTAVAYDTYGWPPYTLMWNLIDYPACIIPFGKASKELDPETMETGDEVQPNYNPEEVDGAPCAIQIVAPPFQDETCLWAADIIDRDIRG